LETLGEAAGGFLIPCKAEALRFVPGAGEAKGIGREFRFNEDDRQSCDKGCFVFPIKEARPT
jgi:hypothetical protein